jgi:uncharacterized protein (TIGR02646 family)
MVKIEKSAAAPAVLVTKGKQAIQDLCALYDSDPAAYHSDTGKPEKKIQKFTFDSSLYGHESVKEQLKADQGGKCCYCEAPFTANGYGDVEHFRPKAAYLATNQDKLTYPGYYWLAYAWSNLIFSCQICNQQFKKNHFALADESKRATNHHAHDALPHEEPLLIDPTTDDPEAHLTYVAEVVQPKDGSNRGKYVIAKFGLDRGELADLRQARFQQVDSALEFANLNLADAQEVVALCKAFKISSNRLQSLVERARHLQNTAALRSAPFAGMIRANFPSLRRD